MLRNLSSNSSHAPPGVPSWEGWHLYLTSTVAMMPGDAAWAFSLPGLRTTLFHSLLCPIY
eukprot:407558-Prymnesium_polylepis.1